MSWGSSYNLNSRLTYLEYLLTTGPLPPALMPNLEEVLTDGNSAGGLGITNLLSESFSNGINIIDACNNSIVSNTLTGNLAINSSTNIDINANGGGILNLSSGDNTFISAGGDINIDAPSGNVYINGNIPLTAIPELSQVLTAGSSGNPGQTLSLNTAGAITTYGGYTIDCDSDFVVGTSGGDVMSLNCFNNFLSIYRNNTVIPEGYIYTFGGSQTNFSPTEIIVTDGITTNTINKNGYTTKNSVQNSAHYLNFSDNSATGIGPIQKTTGISCNPNLNSITATTFNGALNGNALSSTTIFTPNTTGSPDQFPFGALTSQYPGNNTLKILTNDAGVPIFTCNPQSIGTLFINGGPGITAYPYSRLQGGYQELFQDNQITSKLIPTELLFTNFGLSSSLTASSLTVGNGTGTINGIVTNSTNATNSSNSVITTAAANTNYTLLVATANTGTLPILGSGSDLNYNPVSQTLSVKNMIVSGNETQTGIITTNVLKTDIMYQQVSYTNTAVVSIPTTTALLAYGTFFMSTYDTGSTLANSIVQYIFPTLPTDGSMDGYTFQIRKLRGGVNQTTQNWIFTAPGNYILPNGNSLNLGSGGAVNNTTPNSFTQRFTIATYASVGYYVGCNN